MRVRLDPANGRAEIGSQSIPLRLGPQSGQLQVGGANGPLLRPVSFLERSRLLRLAQTATDPQHALGRLLVEAMSSGSGHVDPLILEIITLALAGADSENAPSISETMLVVVKATGWTSDHLMQIDAIEVDQLAIQLTPPPADDGWTRIVFASAPDRETADPDSAATELHQIRHILAGNLLRRWQPSAPIQLSDQVAPLASRPTEADDGMYPTVMGNRSETKNPAPIANSLDALPRASGNVRSEQKVPKPYTQTPIFSAVGKVKFPSTSPSQPVATPTVKNNQQLSTAQTNGSPATQGHGSPEINEHPLERAGQPRPTMQMGRSINERLPDASQTLSANALQGNVTNTIAPLPAAMSHTGDANTARPLSAQPVLAPPIGSQTLSANARSAAYGDDQHREARLAAPGLGLNSIDSQEIVDFADNLAQLLHQEADLRGIDR